MNDTKAKYKIECPCCHGAKYLYVFEEGDDREPQKFQCTHCMGEGWVMSEVAQ